MNSALICNPGLVKLSSCLLSKERAKNRGRNIIKKNEEDEYEIIQIAGCGCGNDVYLGKRNTYKEALELILERFHQI